MLFVIGRACVKKLSHVYLKFLNSSKRSRRQQRRADRGVPEYLHAPPNPTSRESVISSAPPLQITSTFRDTTQPCLTSLTNRDCLREEGKQTRDPALSISTAELLNHACCLLRYVLRRRFHLHPAPIARNTLRIDRIAFWTRSLCESLWTTLLADWLSDTSAHYLKSVLAVKVSYPSTSVSHSRHASWTRYVYRSP